MDFVPKHTDNTQKIDRNYLLLNSTDYGTLDRYHWNSQNEEAAIGKMAASRSVTEEILGKQYVPDLPQSLPKGRPRPTHLHEDQGVRLRLGKRPTHRKKSITLSGI